MVDAQQLPFDDASVDAVIAIFLLYLVPNHDTHIPGDPARAASGGGASLLRRWGKLITREMKQLVDRFDPTLVPWPDVRFKLEMGGLELARWFDDVEVRRHPDELIVTEAEPLADFILVRQPTSAG